MKSLMKSIEKVEDNYKVKQKSGAGISVLAIGDPHFKLDNMDVIDTYTHRVKEIVKKEKPGFVVILGDLLHTHEKLHTMVINKAYTFIDNLRKYTEVYVIVGNHDYINNTQFLSDLHWMNAMKYWDRVTIVDKGCSRDTDFGKFVFVPYVAPGRFVEALDLVDANWRSARTIFCHQEFYGCKMGAIISEEGDQWSTSLPLCISGHIHDKQKLDNIYYTGSSMQHAFGESHDKTINLFHFDDIIRIENIDLGLPCKKILYMNMDNIKSFQKPNETDQIRITLDATMEEYKQFKNSKKYNELVKQGIKIHYKPKNIKTVELPTETSDQFQDILLRLVNNQHNPQVKQLFTEYFSA
jgi:DNA repair exonuclease SbcCD nuclease subunit